MGENTVRLGLPLLAAGQSQKELWHNTAVAQLDQLVQPSVQGWGGNIPPDAPPTGGSWIVGPIPEGVWADHGNSLATWSDAGWAFAPAFEGLAVWSAVDGAALRHVGGSWRLDAVRATALHFAGHQVVGPQLPAIDDPDGGTTVDGAARAAVTAILSALRNHGLIAT